jgi:hypothetical protein
MLYMESLIDALDNFETEMEDIKTAEVNNNTDYKYQNLVQGYKMYLEQSRELAELELVGAINNVIQDNVELNGYNFHILHSLINSVNNANDRISTLELEIRLLKLNPKGGKGKKKYTKRVMSNNLAK